MLKQKIVKKNGKSFLVIGGGWSLNCPFCKKKIVASTKQEVSKLYYKHFDSCEEYKKRKEVEREIDRLKKAGCLDEMIEIYKAESIEDDLKELMKKHKLSIGEFRKRLDFLESVEV